MESEEIDLDNYCHEPALPGNMENEPVYEIPKSVFDKLVF
jgi:hypothetical protein